MNLPDIVLPDGTLFNIDNVQKIVGYQIVHKQTGRILPDTTRQQIYSKAAAIRKMNHVATQYTVMHSQLDIWEYELLSIYEFEVDGHVFIKDIDDHLFD